MIDDYYFNFQGMLKSVNLLAYVWLQFSFATV